MSINHFAILIGINNYQEKPLQGSVRDVQNIEQHLKAWSTSVRIQKFTATTSPDSLLAGPTEDQNSWPTYHNVTTAIADTISQAKSGDFVYIHYSGHGTRAAPGSQFSSTSTGDLALVLLDGPDGTGVRYLWGPALAIRLKAMVGKGVVVTLVLDCCFSASVYRVKDPRVRFLPYHNEIGSRYSFDSEAFGTEEDEDTAGLSSASR